MSLFHNPVFILFMVIASGELIGHIKLRSFSLGSSAVIFTGLAFGHFGLTLPMEFQTLGLVLFIYSVGLQAGPGFLSSFKQQGMNLSLGALLLVSVGFAATLLCSWLFGFDAGIATGLFSGALTSTPGLAVAVETIGDPLTPAAYGLTYCFGVVGVILFVSLLPKLMGVNLEKEEQTLKNESNRDHPGIIHEHIEITNPNIYGKKVAELDLANIAPVILTRLLRRGAAEPEIIYGNTALQEGDKLRIVGDKTAIDKATLLLGQPVPEEINFNRGLTKKRLLVSKHTAVGYSIEALNLKKTFNIQISRINRNGFELTPNQNTRLHVGDVLHVVGEEESIENAARLLGNNTRETFRTDLGPIILGLLIGCLLGQVPLSLPFIGEFSLGLSGGVLLAGLLLSNLYKTGPLIWDIPSTSNSFIRQLGLLLFLATVGTRTGAIILETLQQQGSSLFIAGIIVTLLPLGITLLACRYLLNIRFLHMLGVMTGGMTSTPGLASISTLVETPFSASAYATVYPVALIGMIFFTKLLALIL